MSEALLYLVEKEHKWFEKGSKEAIYIHRENPQMKIQLRHGQAASISLPDCPGQSLFGSSNNDLHHT